MTTSHARSALPAPSCSRALVTRPGWKSAIRRSNISSNSYRPKPRTGSAPSRGSDPCGGSGRQDHDDEERSPPYERDDGHR
ncbi:MAG: hypothetical protein QOI76_3579 [Frankiales bacterium]|nr:hypothetical protein [Frankiales bacterium]